MKWDKERLVRQGPAEPAEAHGGEDGVERRSGVEDRVKYLRPQGRSRTEDRVGRRVSLPKCTADMPGEAGRGGGWIGAI